MKKLVIAVLALVISGTIFGACTASSSNDRDSARVEEQQNVYVDSQPVPFFDWSLERHLLVELYKARNSAVTTYSYIRNLNGEVVFSCDSIGFPLPADTQLTNPEQIIDRYEGDVAIPQPEPNGLWTSPNTRGTFIFCLNNDGTVTPTYFEQDVEVHMARLSSDGRTEVGEGELKIQTEQ